jgi:hypothetical protein
MSRREAPGNRPEGENDEAAAPHAQANFDAAQDLLQAALNEIRGSARPPVAENPERVEARPEPSAPEDEEWAPREGPPVVQSHTSARRRASATKPNNPAPEPSAAPPAPPAAPKKPRPRRRAARDPEPSSGFAEFEGLTDGLYAAPESTPRRRRRAQVARRTTAPNKSLNKAELPPMPAGGLQPAAPTPTRTPGGPPPAKAPAPAPAAAKAPTQAPGPPPAKSPAPAAAKAPTQTPGPPPAKAPAPAPAAAKPPTQTSGPPPAKAPAPAAAKAPAQTPTRPIPVPTGAGTAAREVRATTPQRHSGGGARRRAQLVAVVVVAALVAVAVSIALLPGGGDDETALGTGSAARLTFPALATSDGASVQRVWELRGDRGEQFVGTLEFTNPSSTAVSVSFTETIPKSLAATVDVIRFDPQPEIVEADPVVRYSLSLAARGTLTAHYEIDVAPDGARRARLLAWAEQLPPTTTTVPTTVPAPTTVPTTGPPAATTPTTPATRAPATTTTVPTTTVPPPPTTTTTAAPVDYGKMSIRIYSRNGSGSFTVTDDGAYRFSDIVTQPNGPNQWYAAINQSFPVGHYTWRIEVPEGWIATSSTTCEADITADPDNVARCTFELAKLTL